MTQSPRDAARALLESPLDTAGAAGRSSAELKALLVAACALVAILMASILAIVGELGRREAFRDDGAPTLVSWLSDRLGISPASARSQAKVAERICQLPHLAAGLRSGDLSFDQVAAVLALADPETDEHLAGRARSLSIGDLRVWVRSRRERRRPDARPDQPAGPTVRFNDAHGTVIAQLPAVAYEGAKQALFERAARLGPPDVQTPLDQRLGGAFVSLLSGRGDSGSGPTVVVHSPLDMLRTESTELFGELESGRWIDATVVRELLCDAEVIVALDDERGHTLYEGRAHRFATGTQRREIKRRDRHCRFPGCRHQLFVVPHHLTRWKDGGLTDLDNLVSLCAFHHHLVHSTGWSMSGDANAALVVETPSGEQMTSWPSPLWAQVADQGVGQDDGRNGSGHQREGPAG